MNRITPNLWFNGNAKEAADFYVSVFPDGKIISTTDYPKSPEEGLAEFQLDMAGKVLTVEFELGKQHFTAINAGSEFTFNEAISFSIACKDQAGIDSFRERLSSVPEAEVCGRCKDRYGLSWQIVPENMDELMKRPGAFAKMMQMGKIMIEAF